MLYILYGKDDFRRHKALEEIKKGLGEPEMVATNTSILYGEHVNLTQLKDACAAYPSLLCPSRLVIVEGLLKRFEPKYGQKSAASDSQAKRSSVSKEWQGLAEFIGQMPPTTALVLVDGEIKGNNRLLKSLVPVARVMTFSLLRDRELGNWIREQVKLRNGRITPEAVSLLIEFIGGDLFAMSNEIDKLLVYDSEPSITEDSVRQVTGYTREANIFTLVDAILERRRKIAQQQLHQLLQDGAAPSYILAMITRQLGLIVRAREISQTLSSQEVRNKLELAKNYPLDRLLRQVKAYTLERIKEAYHKVLEADIAIKTGQYDGDLALDLLVVELCQGWK